MVSSSQPLATRAGLRALEAGGNAVDAAIAAAAVLSVTEPMSTGLGGDCFAIVWDGEEAIGLDAAGPAPRYPSQLTPVEERGPRSVSVPGAVYGWGELSRRFGRLGLDRCLKDAIDVADRGFAVGRWTATLWAHDPAPAEYLPLPHLGARYAQPDLSRSLRLIAENGPDVFYRGAIADAIVATSWLDAEDLAGYRPKWVQPLRVGFQGFEVLEMPPPTQGVAALEALALLERTPGDLASQICCARAALEDARRYVRDGVSVDHLLEPDNLADRVSQGLLVRPTEPAGSTAYHCVVDGDRTAVSFIQSLYMHFGSRIVAPGTGVLLQNRAACFAVDGAITPGRRPYHTIIPGLLLRDNQLFGPFGVMGGFIQAQAHMQFLASLAVTGFDPQAALDRPRFRVDGDAVYLERGLWPHIDSLARAGLNPVPDPDTVNFGAGQAILAWNESLIGGSDSRRDGYAAGY